VQRSIVDQLRATRELSERLRAVYQARLDALDELKKSLLHHAFTGQLTAKSTDQQVAEVA
jgi:type I restriction enzyme S subunit